MLGLPPSVGIHFAIELVDMRKGIDGLRTIVEGVLKRDPYEGHLFVFVGNAGQGEDPVLESKRLRRLHEAP